MTKSLEDMTQDELETEMKNSIDSRNSLRYKQVCDTLGLIPDVPDLYEKGEAEETYLTWLVLEQRESETAKKRESKTSQKNTSNYAKYYIFYNEWQRLHINERDYRADSDKKRKSLLIFPKFRETGKQPIRNYSDEQIGHLYTKILEQTKRKYYR